MSALSPEAARLLSALKADQPTLADQERIAALLDAQLASFPPSETGSTSGSVLKAKIFGALTGMTGVVLVAALAMHTPQSVKPSPRVNEEVPAALIPAVIPEEKPAPIPAPQPVARRKRVAPAPEVLPSVSEEPSSPLPKSLLADELILLKEARHALSFKHPELALEVLDSYRKKFPDGALMQESLATKVLALCDLGRKSEATQVAEQLVNPGIYGRALRDSCITKSDMQ